MREGEKWHYETVITLNSVRMIISCRLTGSGATSVADYAVCRALGLTSMTTEIISNSHTIIIIMRYQCNTTISNCKMHDGL